MNKQRAVFTFLSMFVSSVAFATTSLSGTYQPSASAGCAQLHIDSQHLLTVTATEAGLQAGAYNFTVGTVNSAPPPVFFNEFISQFVSQYSADGSQFRAVENIIDRLNPSVVYRNAGEVDFVLSGTTLEISDSLSTDGQFNPAPVVTCLLTKTN